MEQSPLIGWFHWYNRPSVFIACKYTHSHLQTNQKNYVDWGEMQTHLPAHPSFPFCSIILSVLHSKTSKVKNTFLQCCSEKMVDRNKNEHKCEATACDSIIMSHVRGLNSPQWVIYEKADDLWRPGRPYVVYHTGIYGDKISMTKKKSCQTVLCYISQ